MPSTSVLQRNEVVEGKACRRGATSSTLNKKVQLSRMPLRRRIVRFLCRIDVCWTALYFFFLVCVGSVTTSITQEKISNSLLESLHSIHHLHINTLSKKTDQGTERAFNMAAGFLSLHSEHAVTMQSEETLSILCSVLTTYDTTLDFRSLAMTSIQTKEAISCIHGDTSMSSPSQLYGWITQDSVIPGVYLVDSTTFDFQRPLQSVYGGWPSSEYNQSDTFNSVYKDNAIFTDAAAYYNGTLAAIDYRKLWRSFAQLPHIIYCFIPVGVLFRGLTLPHGMRVTDYVDVRISGASILSQHTLSAPTNITAAIFINATLTDKDPSIMSNNWGQASVNDTEILTVSAEHPVSFLKVSNISDPLMRAALKHVHLADLQQPQCNYTVDFHHHGAYATVSAIRLTTAKGLSLPIVFVSAHADITYPYIRVRDINNGVLSFAVLLFTALFWLFLNRQLRNPLHRIATLLLSVKRGSRALFRANRHDCVALTEVQQLGDAHNAAMRQLREVDAFIPKAVRHMLRTESSSASTSMTVMRTAASLLSSDAPPTARSKKLAAHLSTVVYVTIRAAASDTHRVTNRSLHRAVDHLPERHRLAAIAASAALSVPLVNSGPFPTPASLEAFAEKLQDLCDRHHGMVLRLTPDSCVLHFCNAVRDHLLRHHSIALPENDGGQNDDPSHPTGAAEREAKPKSLACKDARDAMNFTLQLQAWLDERDAGTFPDVQALVDTSMFTCGHYRPQGSEQMMAIAMGRDTQREVGNVPAQIGVRVAMTEETASCVRAGQRNDATGEVETGVRQIPVEALRTGRAGLDGDVVILYEALPGPVLHCEPWQRYQHCCFNAFSAMVRGDYVAALRAYKGVADISDLEPGLMPASLRREAASSDVTGGAVSVQVERLMRECVAHIMRGSTEGYRRARHVPFGIDAVMQHAAAAPVSAAAPVPLATEPPVHTFHSKLKAAPTTYNRYAEMEARVLYPEAAERRIIQFTIGKQIIRTVIASPPKWLRDESGLVWRMATRPIEYTPEAFWRARFLGLGSAGALATINFMAFREIPPMIANAIRDAPIGPMSDALRSAVPVVNASVRQKSAVQTLFQTICQLQHPNLLVPLGYSTSAEGGVAFVWEFFAGGTLREVSARYAHLKPITLTRFMYGVLNALEFLHQRGLAHGALHVDNVMVGADGTCKLHGHSADNTLLSRVFIAPRACCVSPAMAAGAAPTPACDMFCYGLMCLEMLSGKRPWKWAAAREDGQLQRSEEELEALMSAARQTFCEAVVDGSVVVNTDILDALGNVDEYVAEGRNWILNCLSYDPAQRPSASQVLEIVVNQLTREKNRRKSENMSRQMSRVSA